MNETFFKYLDTIQVFFQNIIDKIMNFEYVDFFTEFFWNLWTIDFLKWAMIYFFILWVAIIIWVTRDILARSNSIILQFLSILLVVFLTPILWLPVYFMIRPSTKKYDSDELYEEVYEEEIDNDNNIPLKEENLDKKIEEEKLIASYEKITCYNCHYHIEEDFKFCPNCEIQLLDKCKKCFKEIKTNWKICPYCWEKIISKEEEQNNFKEENKPKKWFFSSLFTWKKENIKEEKKIEIKLSKKEEKILEVENIKKEIEQSDNLEDKKSNNDKKIIEKNNIRKSRKQRRREKYAKKIKN